MSWGTNTGDDFSFLSDIDLSASQYCLVTVDDAGLDLCGANAMPLGVLQNAPIAGEAGSVRLGGISKVVAGGTITKGQLLASDANGHVVAYTALAGTITNGTPDTIAFSGSSVVGVALEDGASGDIIAVHLRFSALSN